MKEAQVIKVLKALKLCKEFLQPEDFVCPKAPEKRDDGKIMFATSDTWGRISAGHLCHDGEEIKKDDKGYLYVAAEPEKEKTKADMIREDADIRATILERYRECVKLLDECIDYFQAKSDFE